MTGMSNSLITTKLGEIGLLILCLSRYPQLESARRKFIDAARIKDVSIERLTKWFQDLQSIIKEHNIDPKHIYNMDESGFAIGDVEASQRIINPAVCRRGHETPGRREGARALEP